MEGMKLENYELDFGPYIATRHYVNSHIISRFDTLIIPGEKYTMVAEIWKNDRVFIYNQIDKNDLSRLRRKGKRERLDNATRLHEQP